MCGGGRVSEEEWTIEARREAAGEYASEMVRDGDFDDVIEEMIAEGQFDDAVIARCQEVYMRK